MSTHEKRAHPRFPLILAVDYPTSDTQARDYTENLSAGGLFIRTERQFGRGDRVPLLLSFPDLLEPVAIEVEVVRIRLPGPEGPAGVAVYVPADRAEDRRKLEQLTRAAALAAEDKHPTYRVLLVEDNSLVATMYTSALRRLSAKEGLAGLSVEVVPDGNDAFGRLLAMPPVDLVITDIYMPVLSGFALVEKIRAEPRLRTLPIVVISAGGPEDRERITRLGANFFLQKPVKYQDIVSTVRALLTARVQPGAPAPIRGAPEATPKTIDLVGVGQPDTVEAPRGPRHHKH
jgi:uncharacterized protein (TIGR02266 family)